MMQRIKKIIFIFESRGFFHWFFYVHVNLGIEYAYFTIKYLEAIYSNC